MARPKRFTEKLVVGLTPELKDFFAKRIRKRKLRYEHYHKKSIDGLHEAERTEKQLKRK